MYLKNVSPGTLITDGLRVGPAYNYGETRNPNALSSNVDAYPTVNLSATYNGWGPGTYVFPPTWWTGLMAMPTDSTAALGVPIGTYTAGQTGVMTLQASLNSTTKTYTTWFDVLPSGVPTLRLWNPVSIGFVVSGGNNVTNLSVWVFGADYYGMPCQMSCTTIQNTGPYSPEGAGAFKVSNKTFSRIDKVLLQGLVSAGVTVEVVATNNLGLPYYLRDPSFIQSIALIFDNGAPNNISDLTVGAVGAHITPRGTALKGDRTTPTSQTGDPRGTYLPSVLPNSAATVPAQTTCNIAYTVYGANTLQNVQHAAGVGGITAPGWVAGTNPNPVVAQITEQDLYGVQQYYTGQPT